jgi:hypothetical protein
MTLQARNRSEAFYSKLDIYFCLSFFLAKSLTYTFKPSTMHLIACLSFLSLAAALPHPSAPQKKSFSIDFTRRSNAHPLALEEQRRNRLARRQNGTQNDVTELINDNNSR